MTDVRHSGSPTITHDVLRSEMGAVPEELREHWRDLGSDDVSTERYWSREFHDLEVERVWRRTWQLACWEQDIPNVGDTVVYNIASLSFLIVRSAPDEIRAFYNSCLHRGTKLRDVDACFPTIRCPFHGWTWNLDGSLDEMPGAWDLAHIDPKRVCLPAVRIDTWGGMVFINPETDGPTLNEYLAPMPEHFRRRAWWPMERRYKQAHVVKIFRANWKIAYGPFLEAYHLPYTHPQLSSALQDKDGNALPKSREQLDIWDHVGRMLSGGHGHTGKDRLARQLGIPSARLAPEEGVVALIYYAFPNLQIGVSNFTWLTRFRPYGDDPETSIMDAVVMAPLAEGEAMPPRPEVRWLGPDDSFLDAPELLIAPVYQQDADNIPRIQLGMRAAGRKTITFTNYQELLIRHHNLVLDDYVQGRR